MEKLSKEQKQQIHGGFALTPFLQGLGFVLHAIAVTSKIEQSDSGSVKLPYNFQATWKGANDESDLIIPRLYK